MATPISSSQPVPRTARWTALAGRLEVQILAATATIAGGLWLFLALAGEVREGETTGFDRTILLALRRKDDLAVPIGPHWLQESARDVTALGGFTVLTLITVLAIVILLMQGRRVQALALGAAVVLAQVAAETAKALIGRPRPDLVPHHDLVYSASFPSGHSMMTPVVYLTLAVIVAAGERRRAVKVVMVASAFALVLAVGASRVYLGVHWPTDVLGGWALGAAFALVSSLAVHRAAPRKGPQAEIEPDAPGAA